MQETKTNNECKCGKTLDEHGNCDGSHANIEKATEELRDEMPEVLTRKVDITGLNDLERLISEMEKIDVDQLENPEKMFALDVTFNGKPSNPYFTLCKFIKGLKDQVEDLRYNLLNRND
tara:strand:- start:263 stop:619 length:357 start_codon:yes stop_codon:yes gene_type:complete